MPENVAALVLHHLLAEIDVFADAQFLADAARQGFEVRPLAGFDMTALITEMARTPKPVIDRVAGLMQPPGAK